MTHTREERKELAIKVMQKLNLHGDCIRAFKEKDKLMWSADPHGFLYDADDQQMQTAKELEEENKTVYAIIKGSYEVGYGPFSEIMDATTYLFISNEDVDRAQQAENPADAVIEEEGEGFYTFAFVEGFESEIGSVIIAGRNGGLTRTA